MFRLVYKCSNRDIGIELYVQIGYSTEAEFLDVIGTKVLREFSSLNKSGLKLVCNVNIEYRNLKSENSQDYTQKPQRNRTFMNSASVQDIISRQKSMYWHTKCVSKASNVHTH
jgi:hypothetical protein